MANVSEAALGYAKLGFRVISVHRGEKRPIGDKWQERTSADPKTVEMMFPEGCVCDVGIAAGDGLLIVDFDCKNAPDLDLLEYARALGFGELVDCAPIVRTQSGGFHLYARLANTKRLNSKEGEPQGDGKRPSTRQDGAQKNRVGIWPHVDIRSARGQVVAPPSVGALGSYEWVRPLRPLEKLPEVTPAMFPSGDASRALALLSLASVGNRDDSLNDCAFTLGGIAKQRRLTRAAGTDRAPVDAQLEIAAQWMRAVVNATPSFADRPASENESTIKSGLSAGLDHGKGIPVGGGEGADSDDDGSQGKPRSSARRSRTPSELEQMVTDSGAEICVDRDGEPHMCVPKDGTWLVTFGRTQLAQEVTRIADEQGTILSSHEHHELLALIRSGVLHKRYPVRTIGTRVQRLPNGNIAYDDHDAGLEISPSGVARYAGPPLIWARSSIALPAEVDLNADLQDLPRGLQALVNLKSSQDLTLAMSWLVASVQPDVPSLVLAIHGQEGSCKTSATEALANTLDPRSSKPDVGLPAGDQLYVLANTSWVQSFDNLSSVNAATSDDLCGLATGACKRKRALFTDQEVSGSTMIRPVILNGISDYLDRPDALRRVVRLDLVPPKGTIPVADLRVLAAHWLPKMRGALLKLASHAMQQLKTIDTSGLPSMADAARFACAGLGGVGVPPAMVLLAYDRAARLGRSELLGSSPLMQRVIELINPSGKIKVKQASDGSTKPDPVTIQNTYGRVLAWLRDAQPKVAEEDRATWPKDARTFKSEIMRHKMLLAERGVLVEVDESSTLGTVLRLTQIPVAVDGAPAEPKE